MAINNRKIGSKEAPYMKPSSGLFHSPGPYIGIIKNNIDPTRAGRLQVYIPQLGGADENNAGNWITVSYASPFRGQTRQRISVDSYIDPTIDFTNADENSFQSYGFWFVPPDLNNRVLVSFVNGDPSQGYWTHCISDAIDSHMTPAIGAVTASTGPNDGGYIWQPTGANAIPTHTMLQQYIELNQDGETEIPYRLPVSEPVLIAQANVNPSSPSSVQMVPQVFQTKQLGIQGLAFDYIRGSTSASSIRENPSQVFGISTPGRLTSFANITASTNIINEMNSYLNSNSSVDQPDLAKALTSTYRTGGHQFVMDDGSIDGYDQGIRIRSTAGNEILLDDTNGQIYIINSSGSAWIELSPSGFIDIYSQKDYSIRSQGNINFHADQDINLNAGGKVLIHSDNDTTIDSGGDLKTRAASNAVFYGAGTVGIGSGGSIGIDSKSSASFQSSGVLTFKGSKINLNSGAGQSISDPGTLLDNKQIDIAQQSGSKVWWQTGFFDSICERSPAHEPWPGHEINGIKTFNVTLGTFSGEITRSQSGYTSSGVRGTSRGKMITEADIAKQPTVGVVCGLTINQTRALLAQIGKRESGDNYSSQNSIGYAGKYQFGASALESCGYLKPGSSKKGTNLQVINNPANWSGYNGCSSVQNWFKNPTAQEQAMVLLMKKNCDQLHKMGILNGKSSPEQVGGYLMTSHLVGVGGASNLFKMQNNQPVNSKYATSDANGTTASSYYSDGFSAVQLGTSVQNA
jgi:hypothetical protein